MGIQTVTINIYSNDGLALLKILNISTDEARVTRTGLHNAFGEYAYSGKKIFLGFSESPGAIEPIYAIGDTFFPANQVNLYIVEGHLVRNLTNTTWQINSDWTATAEYGLYNINGYCDNVADSTFTQLGIGYFFDESVFSLESKADTFVTLQSGPVNQYNSAESFIVTFIGGEGVTDTSLISWLETYGELQKVPNLDGSVWEIPEGWTAEAGLGKFSLNFQAIWSEEDSYASIGLNVGYDLDTEEKNKLTFIKHIAGVYTTKMSDSSFAIEFFDGADTAATLLITWLYTNGYMTTLPAIKGPEEPEQPSISTKKFTRLLFGEVVYIGNEKQFRKLWTGRTKKYRTQPNSLGTTVIISSYTEEANKSGTTVLI